MKRTMLLTVSLLALWLSGCSTERGPGELFGTEIDEGRLVVDGLLIVDRPLAVVLVSQTIAPGQPVTDGNAGVSAAQVSVSVGGQTFAYTNDAETRAL